MSSSSRRPSRRRALFALAAGFGALGLGGCGFRPLYATGGGGGAVEELAAVRVGRIANRPGQILRGLLIRRLNPDGGPAEPAYLLEVELAERLQALAITQEDVAERNNLFVTARYVLSDEETGAVLFADRATVISSFTILLNEVATLSAEQDARRRALRELSDTIRLQLALYFEDPQGYRERLLAPEEEEDAGGETGEDDRGAPEPEPAPPAAAGETEPLPDTQSRPTLAPTPPPPPPIIAPR